MKKLSVALLSVLLWLNALPQPNPTDSLQELLKTLPSGDTARIVPLNQLAMRFHTTSPQKSIEYGTEALQIAQKQKYENHLAETYDALAAAYWMKSEYDTSLSFLFKKVTIHQQKKQHRQVGKTFFNIAIVFMESDRDSLAMNYIEKSLKKAQKYGDRLLIADNYNIKANLLENQGEPFKATAFWQRARQIYLEEEKTLRAAYTENNLGTIALQQGEYEKALRSFQATLEACTNHKENWCICKTLRNIGKVHFKQKQYDKASRFYAQAADTAKKYQMPKEQANTYLAISRLDSAKGDYKNSLIFFKKYRNITDSIFSEQKSNKISELEIKYQTAQKEAENQLLRKSQEMNRLVAIISAIGFLLIVVVLVFLWRIVRIKQKTNRILSKKNEEILFQHKQIAAQNEELRSQADELAFHKNHLEEQVEKRTRDLEQAKKRAEESNKLKTAFLNNISHEFRTPMNGLLGFAQMITRESATPQERKNYSQLIIKSCNRLLNIVSDTIEMSQVQTGQSHYNAQIGNITEVIDALLEELQAESREKEIELKSDLGFARQGLILHFDHKKIRSVLRHIIGNGIKFTQQGYVKITCQKPNERFVRFTVSDTGIGIAPEMQKLVFEPFRQTENGLSRSFGGNGLGLALAKAYIEQAGGTIWLESETGKGTSVHFTLPTP